MAPKTKDALAFYLQFIMNRPDEIVSQQIDELDPELGSDLYDGVEDNAASDSEEGGIKAPTALQSRLESIIRPVVEEAGFKLYDLDPPHRAGGVLRVFIWKGPASNDANSQTESGENRHGVILDECARVSKSLESLTELDDVIEGAYIQEVSSPGINRKLSRLEHFQSAIGEFVKIVTERDEVIGGPILSVQDGVITVEDHAQSGELGGNGKQKGAKGSKSKKIEPKLVHVNFADVRRARVDFQF